MRAQTVNQKLQAVKVTRLSASMCTYSSKDHSLGSDSNWEPFLGCRSRAARDPDCNTIIRVCSSSNPRFNSAVMSSMPSPLVVGCVCEPPRKRSGALALEPFTSWVLAKITKSGIALSDTHCFQHRMDHTPGTSDLFHVLIGDNSFIEPRPTLVEEPKACWGDLLDGIWRSDCETCNVQSSRPSERCKGQRARESRKRKNPRIRMQYQGLGSHALCSHDRCDVIADCQQGSLIDGPVDVYVDCMGLDGRLDREHSHESWVISCEAVDVIFAVRPR